MGDANFELEVEIISKETIKPWSPTPPHLKNFNICIYDQLFTDPVYTQLVFFYLAGGGGESPDHRHRQLKSALSKTLVQYYPIAGRIDKGDTYVDCNDQGARYVEAKVNCPISDILDCPDPKALRKFLPNTAEPDSETGSAVLLLVQVNAFKCGGMAIGLCMSHKFADACTVCTFFKGWAAIALGSGTTVSPDLNISARFPAIPTTVDEPDNMPIMKLPMQSNCVTRRYVFDTAKITSLRAKAASKAVKKPTRVEAVLGLIWKCVIKGLRSKLGHLTKPSVFAPSVNLRKRIKPPLPEYSVGNFVGFFPAQVDQEDGNDDDDVDLGGLVVKLRLGLDDISENFTKKMVGEEGLLRICEMFEDYGRFLTRDDVDFYICTSWSRFPFYDADFGWGRPAWVSSVAMDMKNLIALMDSRDGDGVEAWVTLPEEDMAFFEVNHELLEFATLNQSVL